MDLLQHLQQLYLENQGAVGRNHLAGTTCAVTQIAGDVEFPFRSYRHQLQGFYPSGNYLVYTEGGGLATLDAAVKQGAIDECTLVVALYAVV